MEAGSWGTGRHRLASEQCGKIEKSLEDFRQGSDEMESSLLKDQIGFDTENSFGGGGGGSAGWKQEGQVEDHYRDPGDSIALMSDAMFSLSPQTTTQGAKWNTRTRAWCKDSAGLTRYTSGVGWLGWVTYKSRSSRLSRFEGMARWAVTARCGQLRRSPLGEAVSFSIQESIKGGSPRQHCSDWGSWTHSPGLKYF